MTSTPNEMPEPELDVSYIDDVLTLTLRSGESAALTTIKVNLADKSLSLSDQHGNSASMSKSGIVLNSPEDITLNAKNSIKLIAGEDLEMIAGEELEMKAKGNATVEALQTKIKASTTLTVQSNAKVDIHSSGLLNLQGGLVKINDVEQSS